MGRQRRAAESTTLVTLSRWLDGAAAEGLDPADYCAATLTAFAASLAATPAQPADFAAFEIDLSVNTLRYLRELHQGRVDPRSIGFRMTVPPDEHDFASLLRSALIEHRVPQLASGSDADHWRSTVLFVRHLRGTVGLPPIPAPGSAAGSHPHSTRPGLCGTRHVEPLAGGARRFAGGSAWCDLWVTRAPARRRRPRLQARHGLDPDGVLGQATQLALRVPLAGRVRQIELALERLRWLPDLADRRLIAVNIPMFRLWGWTSIRPDGAPSFSTGVIVGRALNTRTPVFVDDVRYIVFRPYWNVPASITRAEILPALRRDPDYLRRQDMEIVSGHGDDARPVALSAWSLDELRKGGLRVRQRPGPKNALGLVKFVFPNDENVYLHDTPVQELFRRPRRDFSHGCVRVEIRPGWQSGRWKVRANGRGSGL